MKKFLLFLLIPLLFPINILEVNFNNTVKYFPYLNELPITIKYNHSVERGEVIEILEVNKGGIYVLEMKWQNFGAGLPEDFTSIEDNYYVKRPNKCLGKSFTYWFIPLNNAEVKVNNSTLLYHPNSEVKISFTLKTMPLIEFILRGYLFFRNQNQAFPASFIAPLGSVTSRSDLCYDKALSRGIKSWPRD